MGQKVNPNGMRIGINRTWDSRWFSVDSYSDLLHEDIRIRKFLNDRLKQAGISKIVIERPAKKARISIHSARPGIIIGKRGSMIKQIGVEARADLEELLETQVHLETRVKVLKNWRTNEQFMQRVGYILPKRGDD